MSILVDEGLSTLVIGLGTVFCVLIFLWFSISVSGYFFHTLPQKKAAAAAKSGGKKTSEAASSPSEPIVTAEESDEIPGEVAAVIAAAVAAYGQQTSQRLVIRSVRRQTNWNAVR